MGKEFTINEIGTTVQEVLKVLTTHTSRFDKIEAQLDVVEDAIGETKVELTERIDKVREELFEKIDDAHSDLTVTIRKKDLKMDSLVQILYTKKILSNDERRQLIGSAE